jgi:hypothetical protein
LTQTVCADLPDGRGVHLKIGECPESR